MKYYCDNKYPIELTVTDNERFFKLHNHVSHYVISYVIKGTVLVDYIDNMVTYCEDETYLVYPLQPHQVQINENSQVLSISLGRSFIDNNSKEMVKKALRDFLESEKIRKLSIGYDVESLIVSCEIMYIYKEKMSSLSEPEIESLVKKIIDNPESDYSLEHMSEDIFLSKYHFARKFKRSLGISLHQFLIQNRIRKAQKMLNNGESITQVSNAMGFYDQSHFDKYFKVIVGVSPKEYIEAMVH